MMEVAFKTNKRVREPEENRREEGRRPGLPPRQSGSEDRAKEGTGEPGLLLILLTDRGSGEYPFLSHVLC